MAARTRQAVDLTYSCRLSSLGQIRCGEAGSMPSRLEFAAKISRKTLHSHSPQADKILHRGLTIPICRKQSYMTGPFRRKLTSPSLNRSLEAKRGRARRAESADTQPYCMRMGTYSLVLTCPSDYLAVREFYVFENASK